MLIIKIPFDPIIIQLGPIIISWHGFFMSAGMILAVYLCLQIKEKFNYNEDMVFNTALAAIPSGIIGARLLFVFEYWTFYAANPIKIIKAKWRYLYLGRHYWWHYWWFFIRIFF